METNIKRTILDEAMFNLKEKKIIINPWGETKIARLDRSEKVDPKKPFKALLAAWIFGMIGTLQCLRQAPMMNFSCQRFELVIKEDGDLVVRYFRMMDLGEKKKLVSFDSVPLGNVREV